MARGVPLISDKLPQQRDVGLGDLCETPLFPRVCERLRNELRACVLLPHLPEPRFAQAGVNGGALEGVARGDGRRLSLLSLFVLEKV